VPQPGAEGLGGNAHALKMVVIGVRGRCYIKVVNHGYFLDYHSPKYSQIHSLLCMKQYEVLCSLEIMNLRGAWITAGQMYQAQVRHSYIDGQPCNATRHKNRINTELRRLYKRQYARRVKNWQGELAYHISEKGRKYKRYIFFHRSLKEQLRKAEKRIKELEKDKNWWKWAAMMRSDESRELSRENEELSRELNEMTADCKRAMEMARTS